MLVATDQLRGGVTSSKAKFWRKPEVSRPEGQDLGRPAR